MKPLTFLLIKCELMIIEGSLTHFGNNNDRTIARDGINEKKLLTLEPRPLPKSTSCFQIPVTLNTHSLVSQYVKNFIQSTFQIKDRTFNL